MTTLDALIAAHGRPDFVKLDVEGSEAKRSPGCRPRSAALSFEYLPRRATSRSPCVDRLAALGRYEFNWSAGERQRLARAALARARAIRTVLRGLAAGSGDVYARLEV